MYPNSRYFGLKVVHLGSQLELQRHNSRFFNIRTPGSPGNSGDSSRLASNDYETTVPQGSLHRRRSIRPQNPVRVFVHQNAGGVEGFEGLRVQNLAKDLS